MQFRCPCCNELITVLVRGRKKKETKPKSSAEDIKKIVSHYLTVKNITDDSAIKMNYPRLAKSASNMLIGTGGDLQLCLEKIKNAPKYFEQNNLSWTIETIIKHWHNINDTVNNIEGW